MNNKTIASILLIGLAVVINSGCKTTTHRTVSQTSNKAVSQPKSSYELKSQFGFILADKLNEAGDKYDFSDLEPNMIKQHILSKGLNESRANLYVTHMQKRLANTIKNASFWQYAGVYNGHVYLNFVAAEAPCVLILNVKENLDSQKVSVIDFKTLAQGVWASDVGLTYLPPVEDKKLSELGYFAMLQKLSKGLASENDALAFFSQLPESYKSHPIIQRELLSLHLNAFPDTSVEKLEEIFSYFKAPNGSNSGLWMFYYAAKKDFDGFAYASDIMSAEHSQTLSYFKLRQATFAVDLDELDYAYDKFIEGARLSTHNPWVYIYGMMLLTEAGRFEDAKQFMLAIDKQFDIKFTIDDFDGLMQQNVEKLFSMKPYG